MIRILIADDHDILRAGLKHILQDTGDIAVGGEACDGHQALAKIRAEKWDAVVLDLTMPDVDGFQVLETLRREDMNCLVIVVSADIQPKAQELALSLGAIAFVRKPVDAQRIAEVLRQYGLLV